jgi:hypothetical protein
MSFLHRRFLLLFVLGEHLFEAVPADPRDEQLAFPGREIGEAVLDEVPSLSGAQAFFGNRYLLVPPRRRRIG